MFVPDVPVMVYEAVRCARMLGLGAQWVNRGLLTMAVLF